MGLFDMVDSFLHPEKGYEEGQDQLDKYYNQSKDFYNQGQSYLQPYNQFGQNAHATLSDAMKKLLNPMALENEWTKGYTESEAAKNLAQMAQENGLDAASSLGLNGSNTALNAIQNGTTQIGLNDRQNFLNDLMQKYLAGTGIAGNIFNTGAGAASNLSGNALTMGNNAMNMGQNSAQMAFGEQNAPGDLFGKLLGTGIGYMSGGNGSGTGNAGMPAYAKNAIMSDRGWSLGGG
jgi:hypothetical protein